MQPIARARRRRSSRHLLSSSARCRGCLAWPADGPVLRPFQLGADPYAAGQHRGIDVGGAAGAPVRRPAAGTVSFAGSVPNTAAASRS